MRNKEEHRQREARICESKQAFQNKHYAENVLKNMRRRKKPGLVTRSLKPYRCPCCGLWHLGNSAERGW